MADSTYLHQLRPGQRAIIIRIGGNGALRRRFAEMGIIKGESILVERIAPLGDPVAYLIKGYHLSLRKEEAAQIEVTLNGSRHE
ncbi:MAG: ferrous iron transport protein A [Chloroflexi bacterium]|nr:ferrous iron transport protein A [Chloroflexota bacterium]MBP8055340.1 ferrous iron transport protein A [Chloroflexota bacterium]